MVAMAGSARFSDPRRPGRADYALIRQRRLVDTGHLQCFRVVATFDHEVARGQKKSLQRSPDALFVINSLSPREAVRDGPRRWWADPVAALGMVPIIAKEALEGVRGDTSCGGCS